ncbi:MAG: hypothetical protein LBU61_02745, partial [Coriobacteriales bacterium]|nr:hypothetical protein [Coriobacteriales bacterium]
HFMIFCLFLAVWLLLLQNLTHPNYRRAGKSEFLAKKCSHVWLFGLKCEIWFSPQFKSAGRRVATKFYRVETDGKLYMSALFGQKLRFSQDLPIKAWKKQYEWHVVIRVTER